MTDAVTHIAIIPARGGSKGVPGKNLRVIGGLPLVARTVRTAVASGVFTAVVVSSDDPEILAVAEAHGATALPRPAGLAGDTVPTEPVMAHALAAAESDGRAPFDWVWLLQPTSPFLEAADLHAAQAVIRRGGCDSVVGVTPDHGFLWHQTTGVGASDLIEPDYDPARRPRRQDMAPTYRENGAVYAVRRNVWDATGVRLGGRVAPLVMPAWRSLDVDSWDDLGGARTLARDTGSLPADLLERLARVRAVGLDFDGVLTDNTVLVNERGEEAVQCSRSDGWGIAALRKAGIAVAVFSTEANPVVARRCEKLHLECQQALEDKATAFLQWGRALGVTREETAFVGNDVNDLECLHLRRALSRTVRCAPDRQGGRPHWSCIGPAARKQFVNWPIRPMRREARRCTRGTVGRRDGST